MADFVSANPLLSWLKINDLKLHSVISACALNCCQFTTKLMISRILLN